MTSPLIRIPFILAATVGFHKAVTPPHPPPSAEEKAPSTFLEVCLTPKIIPHMVTVSFSLSLSVEEFILNAVRLLFLDYMLVHRSR